MRILAFFSHFVFTNFDLRNDSKLFINTKKNCQKQILIIFFFFAVLLGLMSDSKSKNCQKIAKKIKSCCHA